MDRTESLNCILKNLQNGSPDVEASALITDDGLMVTSALPQDLDEIRVAGMSSTLLSLGARAAAELRRGEVSEVIVRGEQGYTVMIGAGRGVSLLVVANERAKLGQIFFDMTEAISAIRGGAGGGGSGGGRGQLISAIEHVRTAGVAKSQGVLSDLEALPTVAVDPIFVDSLKAVNKSERKQIYAQVDDERLQAIDADTIEPIGMLFEYIPNDPLRPNLAKASSENVQEPPQEISASVSERSAKMSDSAWKKNVSAGQAEVSDESLASNADSMSQAEQKMLEKLHKLKFGTLFEFEETEGAVRRLKLSWLSPLTSTCMFVDRNRAQAETRTLEDTARLMVSGKIKIVSQPRRPFMERAMLAIKNSL